MKKLLLLLTFVAACGGTAEIGGKCSTRGATDECVSGAVCDQTATGAVICLKLCTDQAQCAATENCNGVPNGSLKACHPKT